MSINHLIKILPFPVKQSIKYIYGFIPPRIRYGKVFWDTYNFLQESQWWSREKLEDYQFQQLRKLLHHAYDNVPYYRRIFDERGLKSKDIHNFDDLRKLPYLTKDIIRENLPDLIAQNYPKSKLWYVTTGGSTGLPLGFYWEKGVIEPKERAFVWRGWSWARFGFGEKRVILRGNVINRFKRGKRQWWEYDPINNALILSSYDMTEGNLFKYVDAIKKFKPVAIQGYPSSLYILANFLKNSNLRIKDTKCILTSSETLYAHQRVTIEEYLGAKIYDHYGNTEGNALIMECEKRSYHIISEYGIVELIGKDGNPVSKEGELGEIITTGFNNYAMPFIRYKTGDLGAYSKQKCTCGRNCPLLKRIEGRLQEFVVTENSNLISMTAINMHSDVFDNVKQFQFYQDTPGKVIFKIINKNTYSKEDTNKIRCELMKKLGENMALEIIFVDKIPRSPRGKYRFLEQKLDVKYEG